jgi:glycosyltransferase involved in cell wall biosynthesis
MPDLSVIICTHNPRPDYLGRVLEALKVQTLSGEQWELLLVDNASKEPLSNTWDLSWHPHSRHIREDELGLTPARLRGIAESKGDLLVFVDDDNVLREDYLQQALTIGKERPYLGAWGGSCRGEFESKPPDYLQSRLRMLALTEVERNEFACLRHPAVLNCAPVGAGMVLRSEVGRIYREFLLNHEQRRQLDRKGHALTSGGDNDIALTACDAGFTVGRFRELELRHILPSTRLTLGYFERLCEGMAYSHTILIEYWSKRWRIPLDKQGAQSRIDRIVSTYKRWRWQIRLQGWRDEESVLCEAERRGMEAALRIVQEQR